MINFDNHRNEHKAEHDSKWPYIPDHPYRILIIGGSGSAKKNALLNLIHNEPDIDQFRLNEKDPQVAKCQYLISKREKLCLKHYYDLKVFIEYSNGIKDIYKNTEQYNLSRKRKVLIFLMI